MFREKGSGGLEGLHGVLDDNSVVYAGLRIKVDGLWKYIFVSWIGQNVAGLARARVSMHQTAVNNFFQGAIDSFFATSLSDLSPESVAGSVRKITNAVTVEV